MGGSRITCLESVDQRMTRRLDDFMSILGVMHTKANAFNRLASRPAASSFDSPLVHPGNVVCTKHVHTRSCSWFLIVQRSKSLVHCSNLHLPALLTSSSTAHASMAYDAAFDSLSAGLLPKWLLFVRPIPHTHVSLNPQQTDKTPHRSPLPPSPTASKPTPP